MNTTKHVPIGSCLRITAAACAFLFAAGTAGATGFFDPQVQFANLTVVARDAKTATIRFDVTWEGSWRHELSHDAAWVFFKARANEGAAWQHVRLAADRVRNPTGYSQEAVARPAAPASNATLRAFLGNAKCQNEQVEARPELFAPAPPGNTPLEFLVPAGADGFTGVFLQRAGIGAGMVARGVTVVWDLSTATGISDPAKAQLMGFGVEMVYVAEGAFCLGTGGEETYAFYTYSDEHLQPRPYRVTGPGAIPTGRKAGCLWARSDAQPEDGGEIPATFPNGYAGFYCMKQHLTPRRYAEFLRMLTSEQAEARYPPADTKLDWQVVRAGTAPNYTYTWSPGGPRAGSGMQRLAWADGAAWAAWAGLRPMTELELEKVVRGPREPLPGECGPSYWDAMGFNTIQWNSIKGWELSGEHPVTVGNAAGRKFKGTHGSGSVTLPADWPQDDAVGTGVRCADLLGAPASDRLHAAGTYPARAYRFRAVRTAPRE